MIFSIGGYPFAALTPDIFLFDRCGIWRYTVCI